MCYLYNLLLNVLFSYEAFHVKCYCGLIVVVSIHRLMVVHELLCFHAEILNNVMN